MEKDKVAAVSDAPSQQNRNPRRSRKKTSKDYAIEFFIKLAVVLLCVWILCTFVIGIHICHGNSSYPMVKDGDLCITYRIGQLRESEVVVYEVDGEIGFGRIIAMSGDVVDIYNDYIQVNGYGIFEDVIYPTSTEGAMISFPYTVPEGSVFVLNDFRSDINDSRSYGAIPTADVEGNIFFVLRRRGI